MLTLKERTCAIGGGSGAIGSDAVRRLVEGGMNVVILTHMIADSQKLVDEFKHLDNGRRCTLLSGVSMEEAYEQIYREYGSLDVIIQNTGEFLHKKDLSEYAKEDYDRSMNRIWGYVSCVNAALPYLEKSKAPRIILTTSASACNGFNQESLLDAMSRGAEKSLVQYLARELAPKGITVNAIEKSGMINDHPVKPNGYDAEEILPFIPLGRLGSSSDFGAAAEYLASEESGFVTGQILHVSGGLHIG